MFKHHAENWFLVVQVLLLLKNISQASRDEPLDEDFIAQFGSVSTGIGRLRLKVSTGVLERIISGMKGPSQRFHLKGDVEKDLDGLINTMEAELSSLVIVQLNDEYTKYYQQKELFGSEVTAKFYNRLPTI